ncbi:hypothetical protein, partial [Raoultella sp. 18117]
MVKSLSVMGITDSDFPMSSITGRANFLLTTSIGGGVHSGIKNPGTEGCSRIVSYWQDRSSTLKRSALFSERRPFLLGGLFDIQRIL